MPVLVTFSSGVNYGPKSNFVFVSDLGQFLVDWLQERGDNVQASNVGHSGPAVNGNGKFADRYWSRKVTICAKQSIQLVSPPRNS